MMFFVFWIVCMVAAVYLADQKKQSVLLFLFLAFVTGPLAVVIVLLLSSKTVNHRSTPDDLSRELASLKSSVKYIQERITALEMKLLEQNLRTSNLDTSSLPSANIAVESVAEKKDSAQNLRSKLDAPFKPLDLEMAFGRNWLNKIGIVVFTLGMGLLISYSFKYFGPWIRILFGYFVSAIFFALGTRLEKNAQSVNFGRALWGGGWALAYFTTYAMHHFEASRIINNQYIDLLLLAGLLIAMLVHVVKYKSEEMMAVAIFVAYITATMGQITSFTLLSCSLLAFVVLFLVYKFQWVKTFVLGNILTYGIHYFWVTPNIVSSVRQGNLFGITTLDSVALMNFIFLSVYAAVFMVGTHIARVSEDKDLENTLAAANVGNIACYGFLAYPLIIDLFFQQRFFIVFGFGSVFLILALFMRSCGRVRIYQSDLIAAIFILTLSLLLKFQMISSTLIWIIEVPLLLIVAVQFKERIYRYLGYGVAILVCFRLFDLWGLGTINFAGWIISGKDFVYFCAGMAMALCFYILHRAKAKIETDALDVFFEHLFSVISAYCFTTLLFAHVKSPWISLGLSIESVVFLIASVVLGMKRFRVYAYLALIVAALCFVDNRFYMATAFVQWFIIAANLFIFWGFYYAVKSMKRVNDLVGVFANEDVLVFTAAMTMLIFTIFKYFSVHFISLSLGLAGVVFIIIGIMTKDKIERLGGLFFLGLTLLRVVFVDLSGLDVIFKIITFIVLGLLFLGASYVYNRFGVEK